MHGKLFSTHTGDMPFQRPTIFSLRTTVLNVETMPTDGIAPPLDALLKIYI